jgi:hypothetical protein
VVPQPGRGLCYDRRLSRTRGRMGDLRRAARHPRLGTGTRHGAGRRGRLPCDRELELCQR